MCAQKKRIFGFVSIIILLMVCTFIFINRGVKPMSDIEESVSYKVTEDGSTLWAFRSLPKKTVNATLSYIKDNGYNDIDVTFTFQNGPNTYDEFFSTKSGSNIYYATQTYKNIFVGYIGVSDKGEISDVFNLMSSKELSEITLEPDIGSQAAIVLARTFLEINNQVPANTVSRRLYEVDNAVFLCYMVKFEEHDQYVLVNGITGEVIKTTTNIEF